MTHTIDFLLRMAKFEPVPFLFLAKSLSETKLLMEKRKISQQTIQAAKKELGSQRIIARGQVVREGQAVVFECAMTPPSSLARQLKLALQAETTKTFNVITRSVKNLLEELDDEVAGPQGNQVRLSQQVRPASESIFKEKLTQKLEALNGRIRHLEKTGGPAVPEIHVLTRELGEALGRKNWEEAQDFLARLLEKIQTGEEGVLDAHQKIVRSLESLSHRIEALDRFLDPVAVKPIITLKNELVDKTNREQWEGVAEKLEKLREEQEEAEQEALTAKLAAATQAKEAWKQAANDPAMKEAAWHHLQETCEKYLLTRKLIGWYRLD